MKFWSSKASPLRLALYLGLVPLWFEVIRQSVKRWGWDRVLQEGQLVEYSQTGLLVLICGGSVVLAILRPAFRPAYSVLAALAFLSLIREFNNSELYGVFFRRGWVGWVFGLSVLTLLVASFRGALWRNVVEIMPRPSVVLFLLGFAVAVGWAQVLAQEELWDRRDDRLIEEALELAGYFLILCGVAEEAWASRKADSAD